MPSTIYSDGSDNPPHIIELFPNGSANLKIRNVVNGTFDTFRVFEQVPTAEEEAKNDDDETPPTKKARKRTCSRKELIQSFKDSARNFSNIAAPPIVPGQRLFQQDSDVVFIEARKTATSKMRTVANTSEDQSQAVVKRVSPTEVEKPLTYLIDEIRQRHRKLFPELECCQAEDGDIMTFAANNFFIEIVQVKYKKILEMLKKLEVMKESLDNEISERGLDLCLKDTKFKQRVVDLQKEERQIAFWAIENHQKKTKKFNKSKLYVNDTNIQKYSSYFNGSANSSKSCNEIYEKKEHFKTAEDALRKYIGYQSEYWEIIRKLYFLFEKLESRSWVWWALEDQQEVRVHYLYKLLRENNFKYFEDLKMAFKIQKSLGIELDCLEAILNRCIQRRSQRIFWFVIRLKRNPNF